MFDNESITGWLSGSGSDESGKLDMGSYPRSKTSKEALEKFYRYFFPLIS
jgi:hypothetical protein